MWTMSIRLTLSQTHNDQVTHVSMHSTNEDLLTNTPPCQPSIVMASPLFWPPRRANRASSPLPRPQRSGHQNTSPKAQSHSPPSPNSSTQVSLAVDPTRSWAIDLPYPTVHWPRSSAGKPGTKSISGGGTSDPLSSTSFEPRLFRVGSLRPSVCGRGIDLVRPLRVTSTGVSDCMGFRMADR